MPPRVQLRAMPAAGGAPTRGSRTGSARALAGDRGLLPPGDEESTSLTLWTVGHSTRSSEAFLDVLAAHHIEALLDVRRFPGSRRLPQFRAEELETALAARGVAYRWLPGLGGRRRPDPDSPNVAWRHPAFRAYADHVASEEFAASMFELLVVAHGLRTAVMCAEVLWWRCHRRLIADVLTALGAQVVHLRDEQVSEIHRLAPPAALVEGRLTYDADTGPADRHGADAATR